MNTLKPKRSKILDQVYGTELAKLAYEQYQKISPQYNVFAQEIAYGIFWKLPTLSLNEKILTSLVSSLVLADAAENARKYFFFGFLNLGGSPEYAEKIIEYMHECHYITTKENILAILDSAVAMHNENQLTSESVVILYDNDKAHIDLCVQVSLGHAEKIRSCLQNIVKNQIIPPQKIEAILIHLMTYCGFIYVGMALGCLYELQQIPC